MARRARSVDPVLGDLRGELAARLPGAPVLPARDGERRRAPRVVVDTPAVLRSGDLGIHGRIQDLASGGVFFATCLLIEADERGVVSLDLGEGVATEAIAVRVAWVRHKAHPLGSGLGLAFDIRDVASERRALELLLTLLDRAGPALADG